MLGDKSVAQHTPQYNSGLVCFRPATMALAVSSLFLTDASFS